MNDPDQVRHLRHELRNQINALRLCITTLPLCEDLAEKLEMIDGVIEAAEGALIVLPQYLDCLGAA